MSALLEVSDVTLRYKTSSVVVTATDKVSFKVNRSDRFVLLGPSGCGKSTLLKAVGGYLKPSEGTLRIDGREITEPGADRMMIFQEFDQLLPWKTVLENVMFPLLMTRKLPRKQAEARARDYIEKALKLSPDQTSLSGIRRAISRKGESGEFGRRPEQARTFLQEPVSSLARQKSMAKGSFVRPVPPTP